MKNDLFNSHENCIKELDINYKLIRDKMDVIFNTNKKLIDSFYDKIKENISKMQDLFATSMNDILDIQNQVNGIQLNISVFNKFINQKKYKNIKNFINSSKKDINELTSKYSNNKHFDLIDICFNGCLNLVNRYVNLNQKFILDLKKGLEYISNINGLNSDNKIMEDLGDEFYIQKLINNCMIQKKEINHENENIENNEIEDEEKEDEEIESEEENNEQLINSMTENIYAKIEEKSNNIYIFNYYSNKLKKYFAISRNNKDFMFNSNCYSLYDKDNNCIYVSGGLIDVNDQNSHDNSLYKININLIKYHKNENKENKNIINYYIREIIYCRK
jgi:hypothetical protein